MEINIDVCKKCIRNGSVTCDGCVHQRKDYYEQEFLNDKWTEKLTDNFMRKGQTMTPEKILELLPKLKRESDSSRNVDYDEVYYEALTDCANALAGKVEEVKPKCVWSYDEDTTSYDTDCGEKHIFFDGNLKNNHHKYCPYCGGETDEAQQRKANCENT